MINFLNRDAKVFMLDNKCFMNNHKTAQPTRYSDAENSWIQNYQHISLSSPHKYSLDSLPAFSGTIQNVDQQKCALGRRELLRTSNVKVVTVRMQHKTCHVLDRTMTDGRKQQIELLTVSKFIVFSSRFTCGVGLATAVSSAAVSSESVALFIHLRCSSDERDMFWRYDCS